jgi:hypothetical protein
VLFLPFVFKALVLILFKKITILVMLFFHCFSRCIAVFGSKGFRTIHPNEMVLRSGFKAFIQVKDQSGACGPTDSPAVIAADGIAVTATAGILDIFRGFDHLPQLKGSRDLD